MFLNGITQVQDNLTMISAFQGLNRNLRIKDGEFSDMKNITNDYFPAIGNRRKRGYINHLTAPQGIMGGKYLVYVDNNKLYIDETEILTLEDATYADTKRTLVMMGALICVFPDGVIYNTETEETSYINNVVETAAAPTFTLCKLDGTSYTNVVESDTEPQDTTKYWIDTSSSPVVMKMYNTNESQWVSVGTTYVKVSATDIGVGFKAYDSAEFSGVDTDFTYNGYDFNQVNIIYDCDDDFLIIAGLIDSTHTNSEAITIKREAPQMDFVCECNNRLWGCSSDKHEIYGSKLGDPTNWKAYQGLDTDSYAATVGTQNIFTGAVGFMGQVFFFKEDGYHKLFGNKPSNYELNWKSCRGIQPGSERSITMVDEYMCWKARDAVVIYDGSVETISQNLGVIPYYDAVGGGYRNKYYLTMREEDGNPRMYVYDIRKGTWCAEDNMNALYMAYANNGFYVIDDNNDLWVINEEKMYVKWYPQNDIYPEETLYPGNSVEGNLEDDLEWMLTTGDIGMDSPYQKYIKRLDVRLMIDEGANIVFETEYDSSEEWNQVYEYPATRKRSFTVPIMVKRCDHMKLRLSGKGDVRIFSIGIIREEGSDGDN